MKLTWTTLMLVTIAPVVIIVLILIIYNQPIERWSDLPVVVKVLMLPPLVGLGYLVGLALGAVGESIVGLFKGKK